MLTVSMLIGLPISLSADELPADRAVDVVVQQIDARTQRVPVLTRAQVARDSGARWGLDEVLALSDAPDSDHFEPLNGRFAQGYSRDAFWIRFALASPEVGDDDRLRWLVIRPPFLQDLRLYSQRPDGTWTELLAGTFVPVAERALQIPETVFPVELASQPRTFYLRAASTSTLAMAAELWEPEAFLAHSSRTYTRHGIFLGMVVTAVVIALLCAVWMRQRVYYYATAYLLGYGALLFILNGYDQMLLYPAAPWLANHAVGALTVGMGALLIGFSLAYLEPASSLPRLTRVLTTLAWVCVAGVVVSIAGQYWRIAEPAAWLITVIVTLLIALYLLMLRHARQRALVMLALFLLPTVAALVQVIRNIGLLPVNYWTTDLWELTAFFQIPFAAVVVLMRVREEEHRHQLAAEREREQRRFLHLMAHEIRTPLAVIKAALANLRARKAGFDDQRPRFQRMETACARLNFLVDNALTEERLRELDHAPHREPITPSQFVSHVCELLSIDGDRHRLVVSLPGNDEPISVDVQWLALAVLNLLDNAIKYSPDGGEIALQLARDGDQLTISVADQGIGIVAEDQGQVFARFYRGADARRQTAVQGMGLGLHLVRAVSRRHGGDVELRSSPGQGSVFTIRIPVTVPVSALAGEVSRPVQS